MTQLVNEGIKLNKTLPPWLRCEIYYIDLELNALYTIGALI